MNILALAAVSTFCEELKLISLAKRIDAFIGYGQITEGGLLSMAFVEVELEKAGHKGTARMLAKAVRGDAVEDQEKKDNESPAEKEPPKEADPHLGAGIRWQDGKKNGRGFSVADVLVANVGRMSSGRRSTVLLVQIVEAGPGDAQWVVKDQSDLQLGSDGAVKGTAKDIASAKAMAEQAIMSHFFPLLVKWSIDDQKAKGLPEITPIPKIAATASISRKADGLDKLSSVPVTADPQKNQHVLKDVTPYGNKAAAVASRTAGPVEDLQKQLQVFYGKANAVDASLRDWRVTIPWVANALGKMPDSSVDAHGQKHKGKGGTVNALSQKVADIEKAVGSVIQEMQGIVSDPHI